MPQRKTKSLGVENEDQKVFQRRARNREAAARCRNKRRVQEADLARRERQLEEEGRRLGEEVTRLGEERRHLLGLLALHARLYSGGRTQM